MVALGTYPEGIALKRFASIRRSYDGRVITIAQLPHGDSWDSLENVKFLLQDAFLPQTYNIGTIYNGSVPISHKYLKKIADTISLTKEERLELYKLAIFKDKNYKAPTPLEIFPKIKNAESLKEVIDKLLPGLCVTLTGKPEIKLWQDVLEEAERNPDVLTAHNHTGDAVLIKRFSINHKFISQLKDGHLPYGIDKFFDAIPIPKESKIAIIIKTSRFHNVDFKTIDQVFSYNNLFDEAGIPKTQNEILRDLRCVHSFSEDGKAIAWENLLNDYIRDPKAKTSMLINSSPLSINHVAHLLDTSKALVGSWEVGKLSGHYSKIGMEELFMLRKMYGLNEQQIAILASAPSLQAGENHYEMWSSQNSGKQKTSIADYEKMVREYEIERKFGIEFKTQGVKSR